MYSISVGKVVPTYVDNIVIVVFTFDFINFFFLVFLDVVVVYVDLVVVFVVFVIVVVIFFIQPWRGE